MPLPMISAQQSTILFGFTMWNQATLRADYFRF